MSLLLTALIAFIVVIIVYAVFHWEPKTVMGLAVTLLLASAIIYSAGFYNWANNLGIWADFALAAAAIIYIIHIITPDDNRGMRITELKSLLKFLHRR